MLIKTSDLTDAALDWAVVKADGVTDMEYVWPRLRNYSPSTDWAQGGPIIEREGIDIEHDFASHEVVARKYLTDEYAEQWGPTPLIAAMRCFVASKLGDEVEVPDTLR